MEGPLKETIEKPKGVSTLEPGNKQEGWTEVAKKKKSSETIQKSTSATPDKFPAKVTTQDPVTKKPPPETSSSPPLKQAEETTERNNHRRINGRDLCWCLNKKSEKKILKSYLPVPFSKNNSEEPS